MISFSNRKSRGSGSSSSSSRQSRRRVALSLYEEAPRHEITLNDFETLALDRLQLLKKIESAKLKKMNKAELNQAVQQLLKKSSINSDRSDTVSHFLLRLAYCGSETLRQWFIQQELQLFR